MATIKRSEILYILSELLLREGGEIPPEMRVKDDYVDRTSGHPAGFAVLIPKGEPIECEFWMIVGENLDQAAALHLAEVSKSESIESDSDVCIYFPGVALFDDAAA